MPPTTISTTCQTKYVESTKHAEITVAPSPKRVHQETYSCCTSDRTFHFGRRMILG